MFKWCESFVRPSVRTRMNCNFVWLRWFVCAVIVLLQTFYINPSCFLHWLLRCSVSVVNVEWDVWMKMSVLTSPSWDCFQSSYFHLHLSHCTVENWCCKLGNQAKTPMFASWSLLVVQWSKFLATLPANAKPPCYSFLCICTGPCLGGHPWYGGSALDYWPTGRAIDPASGARFITTFISFAQVFPGPV